MDFIEKFIINQLLKNQDYSKIISEHVDKELVDHWISKEIFDHYNSYVKNYKTTPSVEELRYDISSNSKYDEKLKLKVIESLNNINSQKMKPKSLKWSIDKTKNHFKLVKIKQAIFKCAEIASDKDKRLKEQDKILPIIKDALKTSFDKTLGSIYFNDNDILNQFNSYHTQEKRYVLPDLPNFTNNFFKSGLRRKKLHLYVAGTGVGKTTALANMAEQHAKNGLKVGIITLEIDEEEYRERIDGAYLDVKTEDLVYIDKDDYVNRIKDLEKKCNGGQIIIKQFPTSKASVNDIEFLLDEWELYEDFIPDVLIVDYLTLMSSVKKISASDSYAYYKIVSEELRGLLIERNLIGWTAYQFNREGNNSSDPSMANVADSFGTMFTCDFVGAITESQALKEKGLYKIKQLKSRYGQNDYRKHEFILGVDKDKQKIYECDDIKTMDDLNKLEDNENVEDKDNSKFEEFLI